MDIIVKIKNLKKSYQKSWKWKKKEIWQTSIKTELYVLWLSKQKLISTNWSKTYLKWNSLLIKGYIMMLW